MDRLPPEILSHICRYVDSNVELKALSLQSRRFSIVVRPHLFRTVHVITWRSALRELQLRLQQPFLRTYARELHLHLTSCPIIHDEIHYADHVLADAGRRCSIPAPPHYGREQWLAARSAELGHSYFEEDVPQYFGGPTTRQDWKQLYDMFKFHERQEILTAREQLCATGFWRELRSALPHLNRLVIDGAAVASGRSLAWALIEKNRKHWHDAIAEYAWQSLLVYEAAGFGDFHEIELKGLPVHQFSYTSRVSPPAFDLWAIIVGQTERLKMSITNRGYELVPNPLSIEGYYQKDCITLLDFVSPQLKELSLQWHGGRSESSRGCLEPSVLAHLSCNCCMLCTLSLGGLFLNLDVLNCLLRRIVSSLTHLELYDLALEVDYSVSNNADDIASNFFCDLAIHSSLHTAKFKEHLSFGGVAYNMDMECRSWLGGEQSTLGHQLARAVCVDSCYRRLVDDNRILGKPLTSVGRIEWIRSTIEKTGQDVSTLSAPQTL